MNLFQASCFVLLTLLVVVGLRRLQDAKNRRNIDPERPRDKKLVTPQPEPERIEPLADFDWQGVKPLTLRPFRPVYHITMALQASLPSDLVTMDSNYLDRITERRRIIQHHPQTVTGCIPAGHVAVQELYSYLLKDYLPARYPTMFSLTSDSKTFLNKVTSSTIDVAPPADSVAALKILGETIEDDIFLLHPTPEGHRSVAFVCCFPTGFDPSTKLGKVLKEIHAPVPSYEKIGPSMERFFGRLEVGKSVKRVNWNVTTNDTLFCCKGNHIHEGDEVIEDEQVDIDQARVRMELQTLTRLPKTKAILFSFKTYLCPLREIKEEGLGPQLADAIEGLKTGNAPGMWVYKGGVRWGKSVCEYLRS